MNLLKLTGVAAMALAVLACSPQEEPEGVIPEGYKNAMGKAQGIESTLQDAADAQLKAVEQAEQ